MTLLPIQTPPFVPTGLYKRFGSLEDLNPKFLRDNYLLGLNFVDEKGQPYPDTWYEQKLAVAISNFEHYTQLTVIPQKIENEMHDYYINDYQNYAYLQLYQYPLLVDQLTPRVSAIYPTGQFITQFPREWVRATPEHGIIQLIPTQGTLSQVILGQGGSYLPIIYQGLGYLPQLFHVEYTAGFDSGKIPQLFLDAVAKIACIEILATVADSVNPAGITSHSIGVDGLSESKGFMNNGDMAPVFTGRINQYRKELFGDPRLGVHARGILNDIKGFYRGINLWVMA